MKDIFEYIAGQLSNQGLIEAIETAVRKSRTVIKSSAEAWAEFGEVIGEEIERRAI